MDLDAAAEAEEEERRLEDFNEAEDARFFIGFGENETHGDPIHIDTVAGSAVGTGTGSTSLPEIVPDPDPDAGGSNSHSKKRSKCWNDFDELTKIVDGKKVRVIEERRRRLAPDMVEILSCIKDWELADAHLQHSVEEDTKELEDEHDNLWLDDPAT